MHDTTAIALALFGLSCLTACGGGEASHLEGTPEASASGDEAHPHHRHHHDSPESLRPLMQQLRTSMLQLRGALAQGDAEATEEHATAVAVACDDQDVHDVDPEQFGPRFAEIDRELHGAAAEMAAVAETGDLAAARTHYEAVLGACNACHLQAPTASAVDLASLALDDVD